MYIHNVFKNIPDFETYNTTIVEEVDHNYIA